MLVVLDAKRMDKKEETHAYLKEKLDFPDYYGNNLDALYDCLTEMDNLEVIFENVEEAGEYFLKVRKVFKMAAEENETVRLME